jgi:glycerophosphoryl diester phosphodiesterase
VIVLSHRGYWKQTSEKNQKVAFERSFSMGFGTETDLRDRNSHLVISHDMAGADAMPVEQFFDIYRSHDTQLPLALNIKADGLQHELHRLLNAYQISNYFVFDMAVPDGLLYAKHPMRTFTRHSEYEATPAFYELAQGVWLDEFEGHWLSDQIIEDHLTRNKALCIVSPDLHKRDHRQEWLHYKQMEQRIGKDQLMLCTDFPELAREYFNA